MRTQYDFNAARKNSYAAQLKKSVNIRLDDGSITDFKAMAKARVCVMPSSASGADPKRCEGLAQAGQQAE
jgi:hypothetical protein